MRARTHGRGVTSTGWWAERRRALVKAKQARRKRERMARDSRRRNR